MVSYLFDSAVVAGCLFDEGVWRVGESLILSI